MLVASVRAREICSDPLCSNRVAMDSELHRTVSPATLEPEPTGEARGSYNGEHDHSRSPPRSRSPRRSRRRRRRSRRSVVGMSSAEDIQDLHGAIEHRICFLEKVRRFDERIARLVANVDTVRRGVRLVEGLAYTHRRLNLPFDADNLHPAAVVVYLEAEGHLHASGFADYTSVSGRIPQSVVGRVGGDPRPAQEQVHHGAQPLQPGQQQQISVTASGPQASTSRAVSPDRERR